jgi:hypothetical protein
MTTKCTGLMGRVFGHKFMPCFSFGALQPMDVGGSVRFITIVAEACRTKTYHHSVCQR